MEFWAFRDSPWPTIVCLKLLSIMYEIGSAQPVTVTYCFCCDIKKIKQGDKNLGHLTQSYLKIKLLVYDLYHCPQIFTAQI